jgi:hypothetical protein
MTPRRGGRPDRGLFVRRRAAPRAPVPGSSRTSMRTPRACGC